MFHAQTIYLVQLVNVALIIYVPKFVIQTTIVYLEKFATTKEPANQAVHQIATVPPLKSVSMVNANVVQDLLERHSDALILMNVPRNHVIRVLVVKTRLVPLDAFVQRKQSEILTAIQDVFNQINVVVMLIALIIWLVCKENVRNHVELLNAAEMRNVSQLITKHCAIVPLVT